MRAILRWISPPGGDKRSHWYGTRIDRPTPARDKSGDDLWHARTPSGRTFLGGLALGLTYCHSWKYYSCLADVPRLASLWTEVRDLLARKLPGGPFVEGSVAARAWVGDEALMFTFRGRIGAVAARAWAGDEALAHCCPGSKPKGRSPCVGGEGGHRTRRYRPATILSRPEATSCWTVLGRVPGGMSNCSRKMLIYGATTRLIRRRMSCGVYWSKRSCTSPSLSREAMAPFVASQWSGSNMVGMGKR